MKTIILTISLLISAIFAFTQQYEDGLNHTPDTVNFGDVPNLGETMPESIVATLNYIPVLVEVYSSTDEPFTNFVAEMYDPCNDTTYIFTDPSFGLETCGSYQLSIQADGHYPYLGEIIASDDYFVYEIMLIGISPVENLTVEIDESDICALINWDAPSDDNPENYSVFRLPSGMENNPESWDSLTTVVETEYNDSTWSDLEQGYYRYALVANYSNVCSEAIFSEEIGKDMSVHIIVDAYSDTGLPLTNLHMEIYNSCNDSTYIAPWDQIELCSPLELSVQADGHHSYYEEIYVFDDDYYLVEVVLIAITENINLTKAPKITYFPNPAENHFTVESNQPLKEISISDLSGKVLMTINSEDLKQEHIDISTLPNGIYFVNLITNHNYKSCQKLVIHH